MISPTTHADLLLALQRTLLHSKLQQLQSGIRKHKQLLHAAARAGAAEASLFVDASYPAMQDLCDHLFESKALQELHPTDNECEWICGS